MEQRAPGCTDSIFGPPCRTWRHRSSWTTAVDFVGLRAFDQAEGQEDAWRIKTLTHFMSLTLYRMRIRSAHRPMSRRTQSFSRPPPFCFSIAR